MNPVRLLEWARGVLDAECLPPLVPLDYDPAEAPQVLRQVWGQLDFRGLPPIFTRLGIYHF